ncbi:MAG: GNAT family N-acetyltransferase [Parerythrobacter sp.]
MFHRSERLLLRPAWAEDWRAVFDGVADEAIVRNLTSAPWPYAELDAKAFVALQDDPRYPRFIIARADDAAFIGTAALIATGLDVELGYWIARDRWGRGYATEAGHAVVAIAQMLGHRTITADHFADNPASGRVLRKLGFVATGNVHDRTSRARGKAVPAVEYCLHLVP